MTRRRFNRQRESNEGMALLIVLGYVAAMTALSTTFLACVHRAADVNGDLKRSVLTTAIAEGGVHKAMAALLLDEAYRGESNTPLGNGSFSVTVDPDGEGYRIYAVALYGGIAMPLYQVNLEVRITAASERWSIVEWRQESDPRPRGESTV